MMVVHELNMKNMFHCNTFRFETGGKNRMRQKKKEPFKQGIHSRLDNSFVIVQCVQP